MVRRAITQEERSLGGNTLEDGERRPRGDGAPLLKRVLQEPRLKPLKQISPPGEPDGEAGLA